MTRIQETREHIHFMGQRLYPSSRGEVMSLIIDSVTFKLLPHLFSLLTQFFVNFDPRKISRSRMPPCSPWVSGREAHIGVCKNILNVQIFCSEWVFCSLCFSVWARGCDWLTNQSAVLDQLTNQSPVLEAARALSPPAGEHTRRHFRKCRSKPQYLPSAQALESGQGTH